LNSKKDIPISWRIWPGEENLEVSIRDMTFLKSLSPCHFWWSFYAKMKKRPVAGVNS